MCDPDLIKTQFTDLIVEWYNTHGRKNLPWQHPYNAYYVWVSEVMLQQTQVKTVIPYFERFIEHFPTVSDLANASEERVLALWSGLGYYRRARHLYQAAHRVQTQYHGLLPETLTELETLPGVGASTAAAIRSLAFNKPATILDGNVKRVLSRYFLIDHAYPKTLKEYAIQSSKTTQPRAYTQGIMDLGALCCTPRHPTCTLCPIHTTCRAYQTQQVDDYPKKIKRGPIPQKKALFLLFYQENNNTVYLEKRSSEGIWGGLWCLPLSKTYHEQALHKDEIFLTLKHVFTHFQLKIDVQRIPNFNTFALNGQWFDQASCQNLALPKPMKTILDAHWTLTAASEAKL